MNEILLSLGSNLPVDEARQILADVRKELSSCFQSIRYSSIYITQAEGHCRGQYANCVAQGQSSLSIEDLEQQFKMIETAHGRTAEARSCGVVPIDLDIVTCNNQEIRPKNLQMHYMQQGLEELNLNR